MGEELLNDGLQVVLVDQGSDQLQGTHTDADIIVIHAGKDDVLMLRNQIHMGGHDFDKGKESNVLDCVHYPSAKIRVVIWYNTDGSDWRALRHKSVLGIDQKAPKACCL